MKHPMQYSLLKLLLVVAIAATDQVSVVTQAAPNGSPPLKKFKPFDASCTLIPPVPITRHADFEVRVAVHNRTATSATFEIEFTIETADGAARPLHTTSVDVAPLGQAMVAEAFPAESYVGNNRIRYRVQGPSGFVEQGQRNLEVVDCETRAVPLLQIGWIDPGAIVGYSRRRELTEQDLRAAIDALNSIGIKALIITYPESIYSNAGVYYPSRIYAKYGSRVPFDVVGTILNQASKNGQKVFVGLGRGADLNLTWTGFDDDARKFAALSHSMATASELWSLYSEEPSFYGWYLSHEANDIHRASEAYYNPIAKFVRTLAADKPVMISPSGTPILSRAALESSEVDIFAYQDAVGAGYIPYEYTYKPERRIEMLDQVYKDYENAHRGTKKHLWANLEIWQMDGPEYSNSYAPKFDRVKRQLDIAKTHVDVITTYETMGFLGNPESDAELGGQPAIELFQKYQAYFQATATELGIHTSSAGASRIDASQVDVKP